MMMMTISNLPMDLLSEILSRVPLRCMRAVRLTCKKWDTLWKSGSFKKMHMCNEAARKKGESRMVALMDQNLYLISVIVDDVNYHPSTEIKGTLSCLDEQVKIIKVCHCDGLLLCVLKDSFRLVVWNPYLGQTRWIEQPSYSYRRKDSEWNWYTYAIGYDHNKKSHKILRFVDVYLYKEGHLLSYEIYDFDSNLWRTLVIDTPQWEVPFYQTGVPLNGNAYWLARDKNSGHYVCDRLVCFDFTNERFGPVFLPLPFTPEEGLKVSTILSCLKGDKLSLLLHFRGLLKLELWVTSVIDPTKVSWSLVFDTGPILNSLFGFSSLGLFVDKEKKVAMVFDESRGTRYTLNIIGEAGFFRVVNLPVEYVNPVDYTFVCSHYTPSLVQIQKPPLRVYKRRKTTKQASFTSMS